MNIVKWAKRIIFGLLLLVISILGIGVVYEQISGSNADKKFPRVPDLLSWVKSSTDSSSNTKPMTVPATTAPCHHWMVGG